LGWEEPEGSAKTEHITGTAAASQPHGTKSTADMSHSKRNTSLAFFTYVLINPKLCDAGLI
jgi:hypothetical protein